MRPFRKIFFVFLCASIQAAVATAQIYPFSKLRTSALETGTKVAEKFASSPHGVYTAPDAKPHIPYFEVCAWQGALQFANASGNKPLRYQLYLRFTNLMEKEESLIPFPDHVDYTVFGCIPFELYPQGGFPYRKVGLMYADTQWAAPFGPRVTAESHRYYNEGYSWQSRLWIDDMYMITLLQSYAYRYTHNIKYLDRTAREMVLYLDKLQQPNGLFYHAPDAPFYWGRGNGWMAAGMTELLRILPKDNQYYQRILRAYTLMMQTLLRYQAEDGMWRQLIDDSASWKETSATGMLAYAMITGVKNGWLPEKIFKPAAANAWTALISYINPDGEITDVCEGTGAKNDRQYYLDRKKVTGDFHGQAPVLWCANALLREKEFTFVTPAPSKSAHP